MAIDVAKWRSLVTKTRTVAMECSAPTSDGRGLWEMEWSYRKMTDRSQGCRPLGSGGQTSRVLHLGHSWGIVTLTSG